MVLSVALLGATASFAQSIDDALRYSESNIMSSARSVAMGGAFGALGADLSSASINPAGLGTYRSSDATMSLGLNFSKMESTLAGTKSSDDKISVPFNQIGVAFTWGLQRQATKGIVSSTFAVAYNRLADYTNNSYFKCYDQVNSLLDDFIYNSYDNFSGALAYDDMVKLYAKDADGNEQYYNIWETPDEDGNFTRNGLINQWKYIRQRGHKGEFDVSYAVNVSNKLYFGATLGIQTYYYKEKSLHSEDFSGDALYTSFDYQKTLTQDGTGVNLKLGAIYKPINMLRFGFALHTPTYMSIREDFESSFYAINSQKTVESLSPKGEYEYNYVSPGRIVASAAVILGKKGIVSFDYEHSNYSKGKFKADDDEFANFDSQNSDIKKLLKSVNQFRLGAELRLVDEFYARAGYRFSSVPLKKSISVAVRDEVTGRTEFENVSNYDHKMKDSSYSLGFGYRTSELYFDLAFVRSQKQGNQNIFPSQPYGTKVDMAKTNLSNNNFVATIGFRF